MCRHVSTFRDGFMQTSPLDVRTTSVDCSSNAEHGVDAEWDAFSHMIPARHTSAAGVLHLQIGAPWPTWIRFILLAAAANTEITFYFLGPPLESASECSNCLWLPLDERSLQRRVVRYLNVSGITLSPRKMCDLKPMWATLFPELTERHRWIAYSDYDILYGRLADEVGLPLPFRVEALNPRLQSSVDAPLRRLPHSSRMTRCWFLRLTSRSRYPTVTLSSSGLSQKWSMHSAAGCSRRLRSHRLRSHRFLCPLFRIPPFTTPPSTIPPFTIPRAPTTNRASLGRPFTNADASHAATAPFGATRCGTMAIGCSMNGGVEPEIAWLRFTTTCGSMERCKPGRHADTSCRRVAVSTPEPCTLHGMKHVSP